MDSPSSNAEYLHLEEMGAEAEVDADRDTGISADVSVEADVEGKGMLTCSCSSSDLSSFSFPSPFTILSMRQPHGTVVKHKKHACLSPPWA